MKIQLGLIIGLIIALGACGESELRLHRPDNISSDININVVQERDAPWIVSYEIGPRKTADIWPLGKTISLRLSGEEDGHTLFIPILGVRLPSVAGQTSQS